MARSSRLLARFDQRAGLRRPVLVHECADRRVVGDLGRSQSSSSVVPALPRYAIASAARPTWCRRAGSPAMRRSPAGHPRCRPSRRGRSGAGGAQGIGGGTRAVEAARYVSLSARQISMQRYARAPDVQRSGRGAQDRLGGRRVVAALGGGGQLLRGEELEPRVARGMRETDVLVGRSGYLSSRVVVRAEHQRAEHDVVLGAPCARRR